MRCLLACFLLSSFLTGCANSLFYFPDRVDYEPRLVTPVPHQDVWMDTTDGLRLHGWWMPATGHADARPKATVVFLHGNAQNLTSHVAYVDWLHAAGYNVLAVDYRGYGLSPGLPTRQGVLDDARAAYFFAMQQAGATPDRMILFGQSLGGANVLTLAGREKLPGLKAVVADSAFSNYGRIAREKMLQIPVLGYVLWPFSPLIVSSGLSPDKTVGNIAPVPLLFLAGDKDGIVPSSHSERLYQEAGEPKWIWTLHDAGHTEALGRFRAQIMPRLLRFFDYALSGDAHRLSPEDQPQVQSQRQPQFQPPMSRDENGPVSKLPPEPVQ